MEFTPHEDYGFFGPDSVTWKVWTYPTSLTVGFQRAVVVEELDPHALRPDAAVLRVDLARRYAVGDQGLRRAGEGPRQGRWDRTAER